MRTAGLTAALAFALAGTVSAQPAPKSYRQTVCSGDVCMPMDCAVGGACHPAPPGALMKWPDLLNRPRPTPDATIAYGPSPSQVIDLWTPALPGPHPMVAMIHGGCWTASVADRHIMDWAADDLRRRGIVVWNIEYRRLGEPGGGYPGTYLDVTAALGRLQAEASRRGLTRSRLVLLGHSAGGQLALWAAGREQIPASLGALRLKAPPAAIAGVVDIAGLPDLRADTETACGTAVIRGMVGRPSPGRPDVYADTSPAELLPLGARQVVLHGVQDTTVPLSVGQAYAAKARAAGDQVTVVSPYGGHVEEIAPGTPAWEAVVTAIQGLLQ